MIHAFDLVCRQSMQMDILYFLIICQLLRTTIKLELIEIIDVEEMVAIFLHVLAYDVKMQGSTVG